MTEVRRSMASETKVELSDHIRAMRDRARAAVVAVRTAVAFGDGDIPMGEVDAAIDALAIEADTNRTMYLAWRKRAEEAEAYNSRLRGDLAEAAAHVGDTLAALVTFRDGRVGNAPTPLSEASGSVPTPNVAPDGP